MGDIGSDSGSEHNVLDRSMAMTPRFNIRRKFPRAALAGAIVCAAILAAGLAAKAADDDEDSFEDKFIKSLLGADKPNIEYRERSPLVIPPSNNLPAPSTASATANPAWPKDPDVQTVKKQLKKKDKRELAGRDREETGRPLTPDEMAGRGPAGSGSGGTVSSRELEKEDKGGALMPWQLGYKGGLFGFGGGGDSQTATFSGEPPRTSLIEPPVGYRTPSPKYPYGLTPSREAPKAVTFEDRSVGDERKTR